MQYVIENKSYQYFVKEYRALTDIPHIHTHLEMIYLKKGRAMAAADGNWFTMEEGDLFLSSPNQIHYYKQLGNIELYLLIFDDAMDPLLQEFLKGKKPATPVISAAKLPDNIQAELQVISEKRESDYVQERLEAKGRMLTFLGSVLPLFSYAPDTTASHDSVKSILQYCSEHYTEPITLESMAQHLHLSKFYISHVFHQRMQLGFAEFINSLRIKRACELLQQGYPITEAAFSAGFSSIRTFNRAFRKVTNLAPRDYVLQSK